MELEARTEALEHFQRTFAADEDEARELASAVAKADQDRARLQEELQVRAAQPHIHLTVQRRRSFPSPCKGRVGREVHRPHGGLILRPGFHTQPMVACVR
eukprot:3192256-Pyramimonas_sp.AAC.1